MLVLNKFFRAIQLVIVYDLYHSCNLDFSTVARFIILKCLKKSVICGFNHWAMTVFNQIDWYKQVNKTFEAPSRAISVLKSAKV